MRLGLLLAAAFCLVACGGNSSAPLVASDIKVTRTMPAARMSAAYLTLSNNSDAPIRITSFSSPQFEVAELHETVVENDVARMRPMDVLLIEAGSTATLEPGGKHIMLMRPVGEADMVTLNLYSDDTLLLSVQSSPTEN